MSNNDTEIALANGGTLTLTGDATITHTGNPIFTAASGGGLGLNPPIATLPNRVDDFKIASIRETTQSRFLNHVIKTRVPVDIFLNNGVSLKGCMIVEHDLDTVLVESERKDTKGSIKQTQLLVKMNVASFVLNGTL